MNRKTTWEQKVDALFKDRVELLRELRFWAGKKHEGDCEFSDKSDEGCWLCAKAERERWPQTEAVLERHKEIAL